MRTFRLPNKPFLDVVFLTVLIAALFGLSLGDRPFSAPSESRYVEIGREMADSGDYVTPRLDYVKYFEKPPLFYWAQAAMTRAFGVDFFTSRVPTALFAVALCLLTYALGRMLYGRRAGLLGAAVLATSLYLFALSRVVLVDVPVSVWLTATLTAFLYAADAPEGRRRALVLYLMYAAAACAVLTKGLIGAVLPGVIVFLWLAFTGRWALLKTLRIPTGAALFLLIAVPWHVLVAQRNPEFLHFYFIHEHFERYLTRAHGRYQPFWFFGAVFVAGLFPFVPFAWQAIRHSAAGAWDARKRDGRPLFLVIWLVFIVLFFSLSDSKLIPYILPVFPVACAWLGRYFADVWEERTVKGYRLGLILTILMFALMAGLPPLAGNIAGADSKIVAAIAEGGDEARTLAFAFLIAAGVLLVTYIQGRARHVVISLIAMAAIIAQLGDSVAAHYSKDSMVLFSSIIRELDKKGDEVVAYGEYYQDLPVYLKRRVTIAGAKGEWDFGAAHEDTSAWMIDDAAFWKRWLKDDHVMFAVMRTETFERLTQRQSANALHLFEMRRDGRNILVINHMPERPKS